MRHESNPNKELMSPSTQNFKALSLRMFFLIYVVQLSHFYSMCDLDS